LAGASFGAIGTVAGLGAQALGETLEIRTLLRGLGYCVCTGGGAADAETLSAIARFKGTSLYPGPLTSDLLDNLKIATRRGRADDRCRLEVELLGERKLTVLGGCLASVSSSTVTEFHDRAKEAIGRELKAGTRTMLIVSLGPPARDPRTGESVTHIRTEWAALTR
jgi:hypothetical protein